MRARRPGSCALVASSVELVVVDSRLERQARNESLIREMNERIERLDRAAEAGLEGEHLVFEFLCECGAGEGGDAGCEEQIEMTVAEYEQVRQQDDRFALLPGHETEELETVLRRTERYVIVDKKRKRSCLLNTTSRRALEIAIPTALDNGHRSPQVPPSRSSTAARAEALSSVACISRSHL